MKHWLLPHPHCKVWEQFLAYIPILHNLKIKTDNIPKPLKSTKGRGGKKSGKGKQKSQQQPQPPPPPEEEEHHEEKNNYYHNENYKVEVENPTRLPTQRKGPAKQ